jgi:alpha-L-rhamnosidase
VGSVQTSSSLLNIIHTNIDRSIQSNSYSVLTDCPHREKLGWLEETHLVYDAVSRDYDIQAWSKDLVRVIADAQTSAGLIPDIAPEFIEFSGGFRDEPNWGSAGVILPLKLYQNYGEIEILSTYYVAMQNYINYLTSQSGGIFLLNYGLGDWANFDPCTPVGVTATFGYQQAVNAMITIATALGKTSDAATYSKLQANIRNAFHAKYFDTSSNASYSCGSQASNALALDMGAVPAQYQKAVTDSLVASLRSNGNHVTVGEIALPSLFRCLQAANRNDVLFDMMSLTTSPSYGYQVVNGATSLWEYWDGVTGHGSLNHFMLGYGDTWIAGLSGIQQADTSTAWTTINLIPVVVGDLTGVKASYRAPNGVVSASWSKRGGMLTYDVVVPVGSTANVVLNGTSVTEGGAPPAGRPGVLSVTQNGTITTVVVGCGSYYFAARS